MNIVIAPDSFKESLSARQVAQSLKKGLEKIVKSAKIETVPLADGGEGTVDAIVDANHGKKKKVRVHDPLMRDIDSYYGISEDEKTAVIEMAAASGLELLKPKEKNPWVTTSFGTGELVLDALNSGCKKIIVGIGGSATNDGGAGLAMALGAVLLDKNGKPVGYGGGELKKIQTIELSRLNPKIKSTEFIIASDVDNPLTGPKGASLVYAPQKGASIDMAKQLDKNLEHYAEKLSFTFGKNFKQIPGSGAAGGLGAGLMAFLNASLVPGFQLISEIVDLDEKIKSADLIITGEGKIDVQTQYGKTPYGVAKLAKKYNKPVLAIAGILGTNYQELLDNYFDVILSIVDRPMTVSEAINIASELCEATGERIGRMLLLKINRKALQ